MLVKDVMHRGDETPVVKEDTPFREVLEVMDAKRLGAVAIVDEAGTLTGLITDGDVRRLILKTQEPLPSLFLVDASKVMTANPKTASPDESVEAALERLESNEFWVLPVVDPEGRLAGLVHMHHMLKRMIEDGK